MRILFLVLVLLFTSINAYATTLYAKTAGGDWSDASTWSNISSAGIDDSGPPTAADDVVFDVLSGSVNVSSGSVCRSANFTGYTDDLTLDGNINWTIGDGTAGAGNVALKLVSGMGFSVTSETTSDITFVSTSATVQTVDFAGKTTGDVTYNATSNGSWQLTGTHNTGTTSTVTLTKGTLDTNGQTASWGIFNSSNSNVRTLTLGASSITLTAGATQAPWNINTSTNLTLNANTSTLILNGAANGSGTQFAGGAKTYNVVQLTGSGIVSLLSGDTFGTLTRTGTATKTDYLQLNSPITVTGTLNLNGNSATNRILVYSNTIGTTRTITNTGATMSWTNVDFRDIDLSTAYDASAITGKSGDAGGNSDITFTTAATQYWFKNTGSWSDSSKWFLASGGAGGAGRVPLPQDDVIINNESVESASQTITLDMPRAGKSITWTGVLNTPAWAKTTATTFYGSLTLVSGMTNSGVTSFTSEGRGSFTFTSAGLTFTNPLTVSMFGGTLTSQDAFTSSQGLVVTNGIFNANNFNITTSTFTSNNTLTRTVTMGSGTWLLTGISTVWSMATITNLTLNANTSLIYINDTSGTAKTFSGGGKTFNNLTIAGDSNGTGTTISGSNTFNTLTVNAENTITVTSGTTQTVTTFAATGTAADIITFQPSASTNYTFSQNSGNLCTDYLSVSRFTGSGGAGWYMGTHSMDNGNNSGIVFNRCPTDNFEKFINANFFSEGNLLIF